MRLKKTGVRNQTTSPLARALGGSALLAAVAGASGQISNGGFDTGFVAASGHGHVPAPWSSTMPGNSAISMDTWDHTSANGLPPSTAMVFTVVTAATGTRWAGGWNFEDMHQLMGFTLTPGQQYTISAFVHAPDSNVGYVPGGWQFGLGATATSTPTIVAAFPATVTWSAGWVMQSVTFTAPANSATLPYFFPQVYQTGTLSTYMGIDDLRIAAVPTPGTACLGALGALCVTRRRRRR